MKAPMTVVLCMAVAAGIGLRAEVRATSSGQPVGALILCDCPLSSPVAWQSILPPSSQILNPVGASEGDHAPALAIGLGTGLPIAVWAEWDGNDYELVLRRFDGTSWSPTEQITDNSIDDTEPSIASRATGSIAVAWRAAHPVPRVQYRQREATGSWSPIVDVSDGSHEAAHPVVMTGGGQVRVAFVEVGSGGSNVVTVALGGEQETPWPDLFEPEVIAITYWDGELAPGLFFAPNGPISIWTDSPTEIGFSRFNGTNWSAPQFELYSGAADLERARIRAKQRALVGP